MSSKFLISGVRNCHMFDVMMTSVCKRVGKENFVKLFENTMEDAYFKAELYAGGCKRSLGKVMVMSDRPIQVQDISPRPFRGGGQQKMMMARAGPAAAYSADAVEMEMPLGEGQKLSKTIHLQFQLL